MNGRSNTSKKTKAGLQLSIYTPKSASYSFNMIQGKRVVVVLPAYNAEKTLQSTFDEIPRDLVDDVILVDDQSRDQTVQEAKRLGIATFLHQRNLGYGGNQKSCYQIALSRGADIVIMLHPDYQYTPKLIPAMVHLLASDLYDIALGSRILGGKAREGGMPLYKYISNRFLTATQNWLQSAKLSEYHTGYRAYTREVLEKINWQANSNDFIFDNQFLAQVLYQGFRVGELTCPAKYFEEASSINFSRSLKYGLGCLWVALIYRLNKMKLLSTSIFQEPSSGSVKDGLYLSQ
jgi:glycosyltransferase involved in cell wall biosynthesis